MRLRDDVLILAVAASLGLAVTWVVAGTHEHAPAQPPAAPGSPASPAAAPEPQRRELDGPAAPEAQAAERVRAAGESDDELTTLDPDRRREGRRRESEALAEFRKLGAEQGSAALERAVREALASPTAPVARRNAGLRALHETAVPGTDALLAAAVREQGEVSDGYSPAVSRCALKLLFERAPAGEDARRELARLAFVEEPRVSAALRRRASSALAASIASARQAEAERLLRLVATGRELEAALQLLARDSNFGAPRGG